MAQQVTKAAVSINSQTPLRSIIVSITLEELVLFVFLSLGTYGVVMCVHFESKLDLQREIFSFEFGVLHILRQQK